MHLKKESDSLIVDTIDMVDGREIDRSTGLSFSLESGVDRVDYLSHGLTVLVVDSSHLLPSDILMSWEFLQDTNLGFLAQEI